MADGVANRRRDLPGLTSLRAVAALLVFGYHLGAASPSRLLGVGYVGVAFFYVLSGFVLTWGADRSRTRSQFYLRRFARIYPSHLIVWIAVLVLPIVSGDRAPFQAVTNLLLLQAWSWRPSEVFSMNGVTWSLSCEMFFYAMFPFALALARRLSLRTQWGIVCGLFAIAGSVVVVGSFADETGALALVAGANPLVRLPEFLLGIVGARTLQAGHRLSFRWIAPVVVFAATGSAFAHGSPVEATWAAPVFLLVILYVAQYHLEGRELFAWKWAVYAGKISFCFYLVHQLVLKETFSLLGSGLGQAAVGLVVSCVLAATLHHGIEVPANGFILRVVSSRRDARDVGMSGCGQLSPIPESDRPSATTTSSASPNRPNPPSLGAR